MHQNQGQTMPIIAIGVIVVLLGVGGYLRLKIPTVHRH